MGKQDVQVFVSYARANKYLASRPTFGKPKAFADGKRSRRDDFALELFRLVAARLARIFPDSRGRSR